MSALPAQLIVCTGILQRADAVLLVASRYPNQPEPLWGLPGGRPRAGELLADALVREFREEVSLEVRPGALLYVSESFDRAGGVRVLNATFAVSGDGEARCGADAHVVELAWVPRERVGEHIAVEVVRAPLVACLAGDERRYYAFAEAGITIDFADEP
jgi:ADP-ribose pyrophosphatase YjhB (NUDIX family)